MNPWTWAYVLYSGLEYYLEKTGAAAKSSLIKTALFTLKTALGVMGMRKKR